LDWQAGVFLPLPWQDQVIGVFGVYLPSGVPGPTEQELAFYTALADQSAVAVVNARLRSDVQAAAVLHERQRLARDLHDSVSQALFSMTLHARAAELSLRGTEFENAGPLRETITQLRELTQGALAEMRALIFELRPGALAEEGLLTALRKQAAALTAREALPITVTGSDDRIELPADVEEHLYRIVLEALHNVVKHARASQVDVTLDLTPDELVITVRDDGIGFDTEIEHPGHMGLGTMTQRGEAIGARTTIASRIGSGTTVTIQLPTALNKEEPNK
jgi:signal transduction histidine kinase